MPCKTRGQSKEEHVGNCQKTTDNNRQQEALCYYSHDSDSIRKCSGGRNGSSRTATRPVFLVLDTNEESGFEPAHMKPVQHDWGGGGYFGQKIKKCGILCLMQTK